MALGLDTLQSSFDEIMKENIKKRQESRKHRIAINNQGAARLASENGGLKTNYSGE